jgi:fumarate reductase subunit C
MNRRDVARPPYVRPMGKWWQRDPFFARYMVREATALAVAVYAVVLAVGLVCLARGEATWNAWLAALRTPASLALHGVLLWAFVVHAKSWFEIMPKTMAPIVVGGRRVAARTITRAGWIATVLASIALIGLTAWWAS